MQKMTFWPLGNVDCCLIELENGKRFLRNRCLAVEGINVVHFTATEASELTDSSVALRRGFYNEW